MAQDETIIVMNHCILWGWLVKRASVASLKARLSEYLDAVKAGEEIIVTDRNTPVARIVPVSAALRQEALVKWLIRSGLARPGTGKLPARFWTLPRPKDKGGHVLRALLEEREEGR